MICKSGYFWVQSRCCYGRADLRNGTTSEPLSWNQLMVFCLQAWTPAPISNLLRKWYCASSYVVCWILCSNSELCLTLSFYQRFHCLCLRLSDSRTKAFLGVGLSLQDCHCCAWVWIRHKHSGFICGRTNRYCRTTGAITYIRATFQVPQSRRASWRSVL